MTAALVAVPWPYHALRVMDAALREAGLSTTVATPVNTQRWSAILRPMPLPSGVRKRLEPWASMPHARPVVGIRHLVGEAAGQPPLSRLPLLGGVKRATERRFDQGVARLVTRQRPELVLTLAFLCEATLEAARAVGAIRAVLVTDQYWTVAAALSDAPEGELRDFELAVAARRVLSHGEVLANVDYILVQSRFVGESLAESGFDRARIVCVFNGVDVAVYRPPQPPRPAGSRPLHVVSVSQLAHRKGLHDTVAGSVAAGDAVARVSVAPGVIRPEARALRDMLLDAPSVEVLPPLDGAAMRALYARADVFVLTTLADSGARAVYEALAAGLPVIVTRESGVGELITDGVDGFVVPGHDPAAVADRLQRLSTDGGLRALMGAAARALAERYSWNAFGDRFVAELRVREPGLFTPQPDS